MLKLRSDDGSKYWNWEGMMALNAKTKKRWWLWRPKLRSDDGFNRRNWEAMMALNVKTREDDGFERRNWEAIMALNVETKGKMCPSVACRYNSQSIGNVWNRLHELQKMFHWWVGTVKSIANMASQSIWLNHETWWCASKSRTPLTQNASLEESIVISNEWSNKELQENDLSG